MLTEFEARRVVDRVLASVKADAARVNVWDNRSATTRFANNAITQNIDARDQGLAVEVAFGARSGSASVNSFDDESLREVVRRAEDIARVSPPDPEYLPPLPQATFPPHDPYVEATERFTAEERARAVLRVVERAKKEGMSAAGIVENGAGAAALGNSAGLFVYQRGTDAAFSATVTASDSSGWVSRAGRDISAIDMDGLAARAVGRARAAAAPKEWPAGKYAAILEPACLSSILSILRWGLSAREVDAGRSFLSGKEGAALFPKDLVLRADPFEPRLTGTRWYGEGHPNRKMDWIRGGKFQSLFYDRFTARKHGVEPTPWPRSLVLEGGEHTLEQMIASTERGVLVTHFWYIRAVDPMKPLFTGMTRDGLLAIEDGKITGGLKSFRWNESPVAVLNAIEMAGEPEPADDAEAEVALVPPVKVREFNFASGTQF